MVSQTEIEYATKCLRSECSTGPDQVAVHFIKLAEEQILTPLTAIINNCITKSQFPQCWKVARISPIPKSDCPSSVDQLGLIWIFKVLPKVFEKNRREANGWACGK